MMNGAGGNPVASLEFKFVLACAGSNQTTVKEKLLNLTSHNLDWEKVVQITKHHRMIPQVYGAVSAMSDSVPAEFLEQFRRMNECNVRQTLRLTSDLLRVVKHFQSCGIPVIAFKGPVLATILYGDFTQRQYSDLDLLIHAGSIQKSKSALADLGYSPELHLSPAEEKHYVESANEFVFHAPNAMNVLELQWRILPRFYSVDFDLAGFFNRAIMVEISGHGIPTLCHEDSLLVLCVHAAKHAWSELSLVADIAKLLELDATFSGCTDKVKSGRQECPPYTNLVKRARRLGILRIVNLNFRLARNLLGAPLGIHKPASASMNKVLASLLDGEQVDTESLSYFRLMLSLRERLRDKARFLWRLLTTPSVSEWETLKLPAWLSPWYCVVRIGRLTARFCRIMWRQLLGSSAEQSSVVSAKFNC